ncbi:MAG: Hsp20/alpha crystallin family protein [Negativicutes bacterium]|nr:Hsp20/alpha crystallin family protein [Negativicutes bacterium]
MNLIKRNEGLLKDFLGLDLLNPFSSQHNVYLVPAGVAVDITEDAEAYNIKANIPGIEPDKIEIEFQDNVLSIKGSTEQEVKQEGTSYLLQERRQGSFCRSFSFRDQVDSDKITADFSNGVLTVRLPKVEPVKPKQIKVSVQAGS